MLDALLLELLLEALHANDVNLLVLGHLHDCRYVHRRRVCGSKDLILRAVTPMNAGESSWGCGTHDVGLQPQLVELLLVALARLGRVVRDEEYALLVRAQEAEHLGDTFDHAIALPEHSVAIKEPCVVLVKQTLVVRRSR